MLAKVLSNKYNRTQAISPGIICNVTNTCLNSTIRIRPIIPPVIIRRNTRATQVTSLVYTKIICGLTAPRRYYWFDYTTCMLSLLTIGNLTGNMWVNVSIRLRYWMVLNWTHLMIMSPSFKFKYILRFTFLLHSLQ